MGTGFMDQSPPSIPPFSFLVEQTAELCYFQLGMSLVIRYWLQHICVHSVGIVISFYCRKRRPRISANPAACWVFEKGVQELETGGPCCAKSIWFGPKTKGCEQERQFPQGLQPACGAGIILHLIQDFTSLGSFFP